MFRNSAVQATVVSVCLLAAGSGTAGLAQEPVGDVLAGVTWSGGTLVSFDPSSGAVLESHLQIDPNEAFVALAHDRNHGKLYALAQGDHVLYTVNTGTLQLANVVPLRIDPPGPGVHDVTSLAYDPSTDALYTTIGHWTDYPLGTITSELAKVDPWTGKVTVLGRIAGSWIDSLAFSETERVLYALGTFAAGSWDTPVTARVLQIDPTTVSVDAVSFLPYHAMLGLALEEPGTFFSWINGTEHFFGTTGFPAADLAPLGGDGATGAIGAMLVRDFDLPREPAQPDQAPVGFILRGHVTEVSDPLGRLGGQVRAGESFRGQLAYDAAAPFRIGIAKKISQYGLSLQIARLSYVAPTYAAWIMNDRLDPADPGPVDEFRLRAYGADDLVVSWTLVDESGNAVSAGDRLPAELDLSRWPGNEFSVERYDPCCKDPVWRFTGRVDEIRSRAGQVVRPPSHKGRRNGS